VKKVRIELKPDVAMKSLLVFDSSESLYVWLNDVGAGPQPLGSFSIDVMTGEFIEVEWRGYEYIYDGPLVRRLDAIRLAKGSPTKNASGMLVSVHYGWITDDVIAFRDREEQDSFTMLLHSPADWKLDLGLLFADDEQQDPDGEDEVEVEPEPSDG